MSNIGIYLDNILVVDRSIDLRNGHIIIVVIDGEMLVKRLVRRNSKLYLYSGNLQYKAIERTSQMSFKVCGVATNVIHLLI
jgi:DNA polymerase V